MYMNEYIQAIEDAASIVLIGHMRPDGDCIGSTLGMCNYILDNYPEKQVDVYLGAFDECFEFLTGMDHVHHAVQEGKTYDLCLALDCASYDRFGEFTVYYDTAKVKVVIDHHASNPGFGDLCLVKPEASAACEAIYELLEHDKIHAGCAEALYLGIVHDTGVFKHSNTTKNTMQVAGELIALGANPTKVIDGTFYSKSFKQNHILGEALINSYLAENEKVVITCLRKSVFDQYEASSVDVDGVVDQIRVTRGIEVAIFYYEFEPDHYKFSLRSNEYVDVSKIALHFGGGGHVRAAGFDLTGGQSETLDAVLEEIRKYL